MDKLKEFSRKMLKLIEENKINTSKQVDKTKLKLSKEFKLQKMPTNPDILAFSTKPTKKQRLLLGIKPVRTLSGVTPVAVMTKPIKCPHGKCIYCPGGVESFFGDMPQSYTGKEPATMRGIKNNFDSYLQTTNRLAQYVACSHNIEKIELIIMGGTFPSFDENYQDEFVASSLKAMNDFGDNFYTNKKLSFEKVRKFFEFPLNERNKEVALRVNNKLLGLKGKPLLEKEKLRNETNNVRCVALCIETRPDYCKEIHVNKMLNLGCTRIELGEQTLNNKVLAITKRGHTVEDTIEATRIAKDSFLKVLYHHMPGQPLTNTQEDINLFKELFENPDFRPDALKIYPLMVMPGTELAKLWKEKKYTPLDNETAIEIIAKGKTYVPEYCRIHRVMRDIPTKVALAGPDSNNLRQLIFKKMKKQGTKCKCIRCREAGIKSMKEGIITDVNELKIKILEYEASKGQELFISAVNEKNDLLLGFTRLRIPFKPFRKEITEKSAGIRELHVFGEATSLNAKEKTIQHKGIGKLLLDEAEKIAKEKFDKNKLLVISGIGVKEYYKKLGYKNDSIYVSKLL